MIQRSVLASEMTADNPVRPPELLQWWAGCRAHSKRVLVEVLGSNCIVVAPCFASAASSLLQPMKNGRGMLVEILATCSHQEDLRRCFEMGRLHWAALEDLWRHASPVSPESKPSGKPRYLYSVPRTQRGGRSVTWSES